jgi:arginyl-tRNA synthetase
MTGRLEAVVRDALSAAVACGDLPARAVVACEVEEPIDPVYGDLTTRVAMTIAERTGRAAPAIAETLLRHLRDPDGWLDGVDVAGPGFVNLRVSRACLRAELADVLAPAHAAEPADGATVVVAADEDDPCRGRAVVVADALAGLLATTGSSVACEDAGGDPSAALARGGRVVCVAGAATAGGARDWKRRRAFAGADPAGLTIVPVGAFAVVRDGAPLDARATRDVLATDAARFVVAGAPPDASLELDVRRLAAERIDNPLFAVDYALVRCARLVRHGAAPDLAPLGPDEDPCLRLVARAGDVRRVSARRLEPAGVAAHVRATAAAFHRYYNRHAAGRGAAADAVARGVARTIRGGLAALRVRAPERG